MKSMSGSVARMPRLLLGKDTTVGRFSEYWPWSHEVPVSDEMMAALAEPSDPLHSYSKRVLTHEFAHAMQSAGTLVGPEYLREGGAELFSRFAAKRIFTGRLGPYDDYPWGYPDFVRQVRKEKPDRWWKRLMFARTGGEPTDRIPGEGASASRRGLPRVIAAPPRAGIRNRPQRGGREGISRGRAPLDAYRSYARRLSGNVDSLEADIDTLAKQYVTHSRRFDISEEEFVIESDDENVPPRFDFDAIRQRAGELEKLIDVRQKIVDKYNQLVNYLRQLTMLWNDIAERLREVIQRIKRRLRGLGTTREDNTTRDELEDRLRKYEGQLDTAVANEGTFRTALGTARLDRESAVVDVEEVKSELAPLGITLGAMGVAPGGLQLPKWTAPEAEKAATDITREAQLESDLALERQRVAELKSAGALLKAFTSPGDIAQAGFVNPAGKPVGGAWAAAATPWASTGPGSMGGYNPALAGTMPGMVGPSGGTDLSQKASQFPFSPEWLKGQRRRIGDFPFGGGGFTFNQINNMLTPGSPEQLRHLASATVSSLASQPFRVGNREIWKT
jgi:hypothetical protein